MIFIYNNLHDQWLVHDNQGGNDDHLDVLTVKVMWHWIMINAITFVECGIGCWSVNLPSYSSYVALGNSVGFVVVLGLSCWVFLLSFQRHCCQIPQLILILCRFLLSLVPLLSSSCPPLLHPCHPTLSIFLLFRILVIQLLLLIHILCFSSLPLQFWAHLILFLFLSILASSSFFTLLLLPLVSSFLISVRLFCFISLSPSHPRSTSVGFPSIFRPCRYVGHLEESLSLPPHIRPDRWMVYVYFSRWGFVPASAFGRSIRRSAWLAPTRPSDIWPSKQGFL